jgi:hypothetical protein
LGGGDKNISWREGRGGECGGRVVEVDHVGIRLGRVVVVVVRRAKRLVARMGRWGSSVGRRAEG